MGWLREQPQGQFCQQLRQEASGSQQASETQRWAQAAPASLLRHLQDQLRWCPGQHPVPTPGRPQGLPPRRGLGEPSPVANQWSGASPAPERPVLNLRCQAGRQIALRWPCRDWVGETRAAQRRPSAAAWSRTPCFGAGDVVSAPARRQGPGHAWVRTCASSQGMGHGLGSQPPRLAAQPRLTPSPKQAS